MLIVTSVPLPTITFDLNLTLVILDDPEVGGQSESHFHPVLGGTKIKIENALQLGGLVPT